MNRTPLRAVSEMDDEQLIEQALESVSRTYQNIINMFAARGAEPPGASALVAQAYRANEQLLATMRHPSGAR